MSFAGLHHQPNIFEFSPCTEIGWRLKRSAWGHGYAFEAANASLHFGFHQLKLNQIIAFTPEQNYQSEKLMLRLNMSKIKKFDHPELPLNSHLKAHVLYGITSEQYYDSYK